MHCLLVLRARWWWRRRSQRWCGHCMQCGWLRPGSGDGLTGVDAAACLEPRSVRVPDLHSLRHLPSPIFTRVLDGQEIRQVMCKFCEWTQTWTTFTDQLRPSRVTAFDLCVGWEGGLQATLNCGGVEPGIRRSARLNVCVYVSVREGGEWGRFSNELYFLCSAFAISLNVWTVFTVWSLCRVVEGWIFSV